MVELYPHQKEVLTRLSNGKVLYGGVGTGKSITALAYYMQEEAPKNIYVFTTPKKRDSLDWEKEAAAFGIGTSKDATVAGVITIESWNNIAKYTDLKDCFVIFDEQKSIGTGVWSKSFIKIAKQNRWIMLSGTPGDTWPDYAALFIANGLYKNVTEFRREHCVYAPYSRYPRIIRYIQTNQLEKYRAMLLVEMPYFSHTTRVVRDIEVGFDKELWKQVAVGRWHVYENRPIKDVSELFQVMHKVTKTDPSRLVKIRQLLDIHPRLVVFYTYNYELDILRELVHDITVGEWNGQRKTDIPDTERWVYLVQYTSGAEGWNCIDTDAMAFYSMSYSYKVMEQCQGRIDRINTPFETLWYYILASDAPIDRANRKALRDKKLFNESVWMTREGFK